MNMAYWNTSLSSPVTLLKFTADNILQAKRIYTTAVIINSSALEFEAYYSYCLLWSDTSRSDGYMGC